MNSPKNERMETLPNFTIAQATIEDAELIVKFLNKAAGETNFLTFGLDEFPLSVEEEANTILECLEKNNCLMLVAKIHGEIVSQLFLDVSLQPRLAHIGNIGISVSKRHWGMSIGTNMMLDAIAWAKKKNLTKLQLQVRTDNENAICLYHKLGFNIEGTITRSTRIGNTYFDDFVMGLLF